MVDRAGGSNELFRFSTTALQWEQLDEDLVSGSPPSARYGHAMVAVGSDLIVFGGLNVLFGKFFILCGQYLVLGHVVLNRLEIFLAYQSHVKNGIVFHLQSLLYCTARCCCVRAVAWCRAGVR